MHAAGSFVPFGPARRVGDQARRPTDWFIPSQARSTRTDLELARAFVFTHLFGPLIAQPLWIHIYFVTQKFTTELIILATGICGFWALPLVLRVTKSMWVASLMSFQGLAVMSLYGAYHYGGFSSPFLPWLVVSLLLGLFYLSKNMSLVLGLFAFDVTVFLSAAWQRPPLESIPLDSLSALGWLSITSATVYMTWMALYYANVVSLRSELEAEAEESQITARHLEHARTVAEETKLLRTRFFTKMSHELRTPLNIIIGYSEVLREDFEDRPALDENWRNDLGRITVAGKHLMSLVSHVLDSNLVEQFETQIVVDRIRVGDLCDGVVAAALPIIEKNGNRLVVDCPIRSKELRTDARKLRQVLINLLSNAGKFTSGGVVTLRLRFEQSVQGEMLNALVSDTGVGIPSEFMPRLFTDYEQGSASVGASYGGTGLGLALSRRYSRLLGGDISVRSAPGVGSDFCVVVPAHLARDTSVMAPHDARSDDDHQPELGCRQAAGMTTVRQRAEERTQNASL